MATGAIERAPHAGKPIGGISIRGGLEAHLDALLTADAADLRRTEPLLHKLLQSANRAYRLKDFMLASELFALATEADRVRESAFLGAALSCLACHHRPAARSYLGQALLLHDRAGDRSRAADYETMLAHIDGLPSSAEPPIRRREPLSEEAPWYWRYAKRHPDRASAGDRDGFDQHFLKGLVPEVPLLRHSDKIATIGSCFAQNLSKRLGASGYGPSTDRAQGAGHLYVNDNFFTTHMLREAFDYAFGSTAEREHWDDGAAINPRAILYSIHSVRATLEHADAYVITLGLAEIWYNKKTGSAYPAGVNIASFDPDVHGFRLSTVEENLENLEAIYRAVRANRGPVPIVLTLSPVPLAATFRDMPCVAANSVSKAVLRLAIDRLMESHGDDARLFYFPSYEIVRDYFVDPFLDDMRHVKDNIVSFVVDHFRRKFIVED